MGTQASCLECPSKLLPDPIHLDSESVLYLSDSHEQFTAWAAILSRGSLIHFRIKD